MCFLFTKTTVDHFFKKFCPNAPSHLPVERDLAGKIQSKTYYLFMDKIDVENLKSIFWNIFKRYFLLLEILIFQLKKYVFEKKTIENQYFHFSKKVT